MLVVALAYLAIAGRAVARRPETPEVAHLLALYAVAAAAWAAVDAARYFGLLARWPPDVLSQWPLYAAFSLSLIFLDLTHAFLRARGSVTRWYALGLVWLAAVIVIDSDVLRLASVLLAWRGWFIGRTALTQAALTLGWGLATAAAARLTIQIYRRASQPLHRNRLAYWSIVVALGVAAMALLLVRQDVAGNLVLLGAGVVAALAVSTHTLPDVRQVLRLAVAFALVTGLAVLGYTIVIWFAPEAQRLLPGLSPLAVTAVLAALVVLALNPLLGLIRRRLQLWASGSRYDARLLVGEYGLKISGILELDRLADVALGLIGSTLGLERGALFVVDPPSADPNRAQFFALRTIGALGPLPPSGALLPDSLVAAFLTQEFAPLTQYELDLNPRFRDIAASERVWLQGLGMDVYVPIYASHSWIGLLALGPKVSRHRYFEADLQLLSTLADQTAVALQNARLVDDLVRLNAEIKQANTALDQANQRLAHLDQVKSDFINVISHELRTPMSILYGYAQILLSDLDGNGDDYHRQLVEGINTGTGRMQEIIENMLDVTKIDSRALVLSSRPIYLHVIIEQVLARLRRALVERRLEVKLVSLNVLPPVEADGAALTKVFHHLVVNAVKFTPDGGCITITGRWLDEALPGGAVEIAIRDTGIGIDPRFLDLIFTKFYQMGEVTLHSSGKTKFKGGGPGLGLAIARGIVEAHGGRLRAESSGHDETNLPGSRFVVLLPFSQRREVER